MPSPLDIFKVVNAIKTTADNVKNALDSASEDLPPLPAGSAPDSKFQPTDMTPQTVFMQNDLWKFDIVFDNKAVKPFVLPANQIENFSIKHNILDPIYLSGAITVKSRRLGNINLLTKDYSQEYVFRGDGEDVITFKVNPAYDGPLKNILDEKIWFLNLQFRVYEVEDVPREGWHYKVIKFYHEPIHILRNTAASFSTADYIKTETPVYLLSNEERKIPTGEALKQIYKNAGLQDYIDEKNWDIGSSKIFYSSGSNVVHQQDIEYILKKHTSSDGNYKGVLYYNRGENKLQLLSLKHFFDRAMKNEKEPGEYQLDHLWINPSNAGEENTQIITPKAAKTDDNDFKKDIKIRSHNILAEENFQLIEPNADTSMGYIITTGVHTYNHRDKKFKCYLKDNDAVGIKNHFKENFTDSLYPVKKGFPLVTFNDFVKENASHRHVYQPYENNSEEVFFNYGRNFVIQNMVFSNLGISMKLPGSTHRHAGRFVAIEKNEYNDTKYHYKLLGQWFIGESILAWENGDLVNYVTAVKVNSHENLKLEKLKS